MTDPEILLAMLRCGTLRAKLVATELEEVGVCLKHGAIDTDTAIRWLQDIDAAQFLYLPPMIEGSAGHMEAAE